MAKKFNRNVVVTIARMQPDIFFADPDNRNAIVVGHRPGARSRGLDIRFKIEKTLTEQPNTAEIEIFNANDQSRAAFQVKPSLVCIEAGYGAELARLFEGDLMFAASEHQSVDWITKVTAAEGGRAYSRARINRSYASGTTYLQAIKETAKSMGLKVPTNVSEAKDLAKQFVSGATLTGPSSAQMTKLLKANGMGWSVQNGQLQVLTEFGVRADEAIVISRKTGMVGSPVLGAPKEPGDPVSIKVRTLLEPALLPGGRIRVIADNVDGLFRIDKVSISCTNFEQDFYSDVEGHML